MWSKAKFVNRKFLMEDAYQQRQVENNGDNVIKYREHGGERLYLKHVP